MYIIIVSVKKKRQESILVACPVSESRGAQERKGERARETNRSLNHSWRSNPSTGRQPSSKPNSFW